MDVKWRQLGLPLGISMILGLSGCVVDESMRVEAAKISIETQKAEREKKLREEWSGKSYKELVEEYGMPQLTMHVTRKGGPPSTGFVYDNGDGSGCIDAFVVLQGEGTVIDYFCR